MFTGRTGEPKLHAQKIIESWKQNVDLWKKQTRKEYQPYSPPQQGSLLDHHLTYLSRTYNALNLILEEEFWAEINKLPMDNHQPKILEIGLGIGDGPVSEPLEIMAIFGQHGLLPQITTMDKDLDALSLFFDSNCLSTVINNEQLKRKMRRYPSYLATYHAAKTAIENTLGTKETNGQISIPEYIGDRFFPLHQELVLWEPGEKCLNKFSFACALNVFSYIHEVNAFALAFLPMLKVTKAKGFVLISGAADNRLNILKTELAMATFGYRVINPSASAYLLAQKD